jgi:hypothetical protein
LGPCLFHINYFKTKLLAKKLVYGLVAIKQNFGQKWGSFEGPNSKKEKEK